MQDLLRFRNSEKGKLSLVTSKVPELLKNISELWKNDKPDHIENILDPSDRAGSGHGSPDVEYAFVLFSRFSNEAT